MRAAELITSNREDVDEVQQNVSKGLNSLSAAAVFNPDTDLNLKRSSERSPGITSRAETALLFLGDHS